MSRDDEFAEFVAARWARFVKSAVLLGCAPDRDAYAYRVLLNCHRDSRRRHWWRERPTGELPDLSAADDTTAASDVAVDVERALSRLSTPASEAVVLRYYAHLSEQETGGADGRLAEEKHA